MRACSLFFIIFLLFGSQILFAQNGTFPDEESPDSPWEEIITSPYDRGDRNFIISLGVVFPTLFAGDIENNRHGLRLGGAGSLAFNYFLSPSIFVGGELSGAFIGTRGGNMLYIVPFGARIGYQFIFNRIEIPLSFMIGGAAHSYLERGYFGLIAKPGASAFWRLNSDWSFGLNCIWWFVPQWPKNNHTVYGNFLELTLSARYHF
jgi:hypothetical protein